jgi:hypothetical protein
MESSMITRSNSVLKILAVLSITAAGFALAGCSLLAPSMPTASGDAHDIFSIKVGDCLNDAAKTGQVSTVPTVDCSSPHDSEAYFTNRLPDGGYPGDSTVTSGAETICAPAFTSFIGKAVAHSNYNYSYYVPTSDSWASGDREVVCVAFTNSGDRVTGTLKGIEG